MRIEQLTADNARSQGAERRAWYARHNPAHPRGVAAAIERALAARAAATSSRRAPLQAVVLGAGACTEVPLETLARACASITLVDLDVPAMRHARQELPRALRARVDLLRADLSGGVSASLDALLEAGRLHEFAHRGDDLLLDAAAACLENCSVPDLPMPPKLVGKRFGLVVSTLVMTQLFSLPLLDTTDRIAHISREAASIVSAHPRYAAAVHAFQRRVALGHLNLLATLLAPGGAAALITDVTGYLIPPTGGRSPLAVREALPLLPANVFDLPAELDRRFVRVGVPKHWEWQATAASAYAPGRTYGVDAYVMRAKVHSLAP